MNRETAIKTAAKWWTDKLRQRAPHSNGDNSPASVLACMLADIGSDNVQEEQLAVFTRELENGIREAMAENERWVCLFCDYNPNLILRSAAEKAGISTMNFPYKTCMDIEMRGYDTYVVQVSDGYAAPYVDVAPCE